jgi:hypothetical protein
LIGRYDGETEKTEEPFKLMLNRVHEKPRTDLEAGSPSFKENAQQE